MTQSIVQPEADDMARLLARRHLQAEIGGRKPNTFSNRARRVDDRPVPVKNKGE